MKRKIFFASGVLLLAAAVSVSVYVNNVKSSMSDIFSANVEALARGEGGGSGSMCSQTGNSGGYYMKLCSNCEGPRGYYAMDRVAFCLN